MEKDVTNGPGEISDQPQDQQDQSAGTFKNCKIAGAWDLTDSARFWDCRTTMGDLG